MDPLVIVLLAGPMIAFATAINFALLKAWATGHPGGVTTVHSNSARGVLTRLSSLVQEAGVPPQPELIGETIHLLAFIARTSVGRRVTELLRVDGYDPREGFRLAPVEV